MAKRPKKKAEPSSAIEPTAAVQIASHIVTAYAGNHTLTTTELPALLRDVYAAVAGLAEDGASCRPKPDPAVPISKSVTPDYLICLEDGRKLKLLKRYIRKHYDLSPADYRRRWGLPADYPMIAPNYAKTRSRLAKSSGLGRGTGPASRKKTAKKRASPGKRSA